MKKTLEKHMAKIFTFIIIAGFILILTSCEKYTANTTAPLTQLAQMQDNKAASKEDLHVEKDKDKGIDKDEEEDITAYTSESNGAMGGILTKEELLEYRPNELGSVMILMYHKIGQTESEWMRTPENFKKDLENLYENDFRLINLLDYVRGNIEIDAGKSPVIITFDDANQGQFNFQETSEGLEIDPDCAVSILENFCLDNPDFGKGSTFYIYYPNPFGQHTHINAKLEFLVANGYEIGNHTYDHISLSELSNEEAIIEIALNSAKTSELLPGYEVRSLSLPYGQYPKNKDILSAGKYQGHNYVNEAILLVGSNPAPSPFLSGFDPLSIPRIRAGEIKVDNMGLYDWIEYFKNNPEKKYISDGNRNTVTIPGDLKEQLDQNAAENKTVYFY